MSVDIHWYDQDETILLYTFSATWTWSEYETALKQGRVLMRPKPHYVGIINDVRKSDKAPTTLFSKARNYINTRPKNTRSVVFVTNAMFLNMVFRMAIRMNPQYSAHYVMGTDYEKAIKQIRTWLDGHRDEKFRIESPE